jgi:hypothetical protein
MRGLALILLLAPVLAWADNAEEFGALDLNRDGKVSIAEAAGHGDVVVRFDRADRNRDGRLTLAEYDRLKKLKVRPPRTRSAAVGGTRPAKKKQ